MPSPLGRGSRLVPPVANDHLAHRQTDGLQ